MNNRSPLIKSFLFALSLVFIVSACDTDYNELGSDVVDGDIHNSLIKYTAAISAYDGPLGNVQSNNLTVNTLGVYKNPVFGKTIASYVTQVQLATTAPTFDTPVLDSVYLYVPYYSTIASTDADGESTYTITDSVYGSRTDQFRLSVLKNNYYLRGTDAAANGNITQRYYNNDKPLIDAQAGESLLVDATGATLPNIDFTVSADEIDRKASTTANDQNIKTVERLAPGMFLPLNKSIFQEAIINQEDTGKLASNNVFTEYFRGIYFKAEQIGGQGVMVAPRFAEGTITLRYRDVTRSNGAIVLNDDGTTKYTSKTLVLNLTGNTINFFENTYDTDSAILYTQLINNSSPITGDAKLYVKGGEGSAAYIDINQNSIDALKAINNGGNRVLINEANLIFTVDETAMDYAPEGQKAKEPIRLFLYDVKNKRPVYDFYTDVTTLSGFPKFNKYIFGGLYDTYSGTGATKRIKTYKMRITDHINNLVNKDSTNVKLALYVTESIELTNNAYVRTPFYAGTQQVQALPAASVMHPFGTILYGSNIPVGDADYDKRLKLEIFYTKPE
ncbi:DUF4270 domain-containing protein [Flavobacterium subsaxonicum]|uniref:DUF4270 domain-containing protein n=1 Tax=Flavobacterium subsaxonicum WB 4.1-42 = DSM 21790 TaxID=1121898 RepID=A0A0A2MEP8_9FLAO|nr:DUF4270 domain-containing protein [Flavobacterium subsaxonicum]KGO91147.1 hypothetical protein Q766_19480 [Flavobacterium subsaxonicum WB 4.1-42 = DSM 21790]